MARNSREWNKNKLNKLNPKEWFFGIKITNTITNWPYKNKNQVIIAPDNPNASLIHQSKTFGQNAHVHEQSSSINIECGTISLIITPFSDDELASLFVNKSRVDDIDNIWSIIVVTLPCQKFSFWACKR